jgi:dTDP-4-dehydrorhamnose reductase
MAKVAITGSTGFVGGNIAEVLQSMGFEVIGLVRKAPESALPWATVTVDFQDENSIAKGLAGCNAVVHCAIHNDFNKLVEDREYAYDSYVGMTSRVTRAANQVGAQTIYISSDWMMDGAGHFTKESDPGNPINLYGSLKMLGEQVIRDLAPETGAVCRIGGVMGLHRTKKEMPRGQDVGFGYFVASIVQAISEGKEFVVWGGDRVNKIATPSLASEIGAEISRIIDKKIGGTFHLVGDDAVTRMQLAEATCDVFGLDKSKLREGEPPAEALFPAGVPVDTSLSNKLTKEKLGLGPTSLRDLLTAFKNEWETGKVSPITKRIA